MNKYDLQTIEHVKSFLTITFLWIIYELTKFYKYVYDTLVENSYIAGGYFYVHNGVLQLDTTAHYNFKLFIPLYILSFILIEYDEQLRKLYDTIYNYLNKHFCLD